MRPRSSTARWVLGVMCGVFFAGFVAMAIMYVTSDRHARSEADRANYAAIDLAQAQARQVQLEQTVQHEAQRANTAAERADKATERAVAAEEQLAHAKAKVAQLEQTTAGPGSDVGREAI